MIKAVVVINDLRALPVLAALKVARSLRSTHDVQVVASTRLVAHRDFGDFMPRLFKAPFFLFLRLFAGVKAIAAQSGTVVSEGGMGIVSSLYSITNDSGADAARYPKTYHSLVELAKGAQEVTAYIEARGADKVYLFNGRTASSYAISKFAHNRGIAAMYYEYAEGHAAFKLYPVAPHAAGKIGLALMRFYREAAVVPSSVGAHGLVFAAGKINNPYATANVAKPEKDYDVVMFLGSDHEYTAVDPAICDIEWHGNLDFCRRVVAKYGPGKSYAIRCHPNQRNDKNWRALSEELASFSAEVGADLYRPDSQVSSHELIKRARIVATDLSSIAVDAVLLGKNVDVFGGTDLQKILAAMPEQVRANPILRKKLVAEMLGLSTQLFLVHFSRLEAAFCWLFLRLNGLFFRLANTRAIS